MKKWQRVALVVAAIVVLGLVLLMIEVVFWWSPEEHEQFDQVAPFVGTAIWFLVPLASYVGYRRRQAHRHMIPAEARVQKRYYILLSIGAAMIGLGRLADGLEALSLLPLELASDVSLGLSCLALLPILGALILWLRDPSKGKAKQEQADRPGI